MEVLGHRLGAGGAYETAPPQSLFEEDTGSRRKQRRPPRRWPSRSGYDRTIDRAGKLAIFNDVEMPLVPVLAEIERNGFLLDVVGLQALRKNWNVNSTE